MGSDFLRHSFLFSPRCTGLYQSHSWLRRLVWARQCMFPWSFLSLSTLLFCVRKQDEVFMCSVTFTFDDEVALHSFHISCFIRVTTIDYEEDRLLCHFGLCVAENKLRSSWTSKRAGDLPEFRKRKSNHMICFFQKNAHQHHLRILSIMWSKTSAAKVVTGNGRQWILHTYHPQCPSTPLQTNLVLEAATVIHTKLLYFCADTLLTYPPSYSS